MWPLHPQFHCFWFVFVLQCHFNLVTQLLVSCHALTHMQPTLSKWQRALKFLQSWVLTASLVRQCQIPIWVIKIDNDIIMLGYISYVLPFMLRLPYYVSSKLKNISVTQGITCLIHAGLIIRIFPTWVWNVQVRHLLMRSLICISVPHHHTNRTFPH